MSQQGPESDLEARLRAVFGRRPELHRFVIQDKAGLADHILVMYAGRAVELGETREVFAQPRMPYTAGLLGSIPTLDSQGGRLRPIPGAPPSLINLPPGCPFSPRCPLVENRCQEVEPDLYETDLRNHRAACLRWDVMADLPDPTTIFRPPAVTE